MSVSVESVERIPPYVRAGAWWLLWPLLAAYLFVGWYPFEWEWPVLRYTNHAERGADNALEFPHAGIARTDGAPSWLPEAIAQSAVQVALQVRTTHPHQIGPARIFTISSDTSHRDLTLGQDGSALEVRLRTPGSNWNGIPVSSVRGVFDDSAWHDIEVSVRNAMLTVAIDGVVRLQRALKTQSLAGWKTDYPLLLGNERTFDRPWEGEIRVARAGPPDAMLDYLAPGALEIPRAYYLPREQASRYQVIPFRNRFHNASELRSAARDWTINLLGFVPLGMLLVALLPRRRVLLGVALACFAVSLCIEMGQVFLVGRSPSSEDLLFNTLGGTLGGWLGLLVLRLRRLQRRPAS